MLISLVSLFGGILNSLHKFWVNAAAPILLNLTLIVALPRLPFGKTRWSPRAIRRSASVSPACCSCCGWAWRAASSACGSSPPACRGSTRT